MKKYHYIIISITFAIYGFIFYQKYYAGPDVIDYFRDQSGHSASQVGHNNFVPNQEYLFYDFYTPSYVGLKNKQSSESDFLFKDNVVYFNIDKTNLKMSCTSVTDFGEIIGTIVKGKADGEDFYYYKNITSIHAYNNKESKNKGMKVQCYPN